MEPVDVKVDNPRRKILQMAVSTILIETGFDAVDKEALETLTEMFQARRLFDLSLMV